MPTESVEKFSKIHEIAKTLRDAPQKVRMAWLLNKKFTRIGFLLVGYTSMDSCGCCFTDHPAGWYLGTVYVHYSICRRCEDVQWTLICSHDGGVPDKPRSWDILESH